MGKLLLLLAAGTLIPAALILPNLPKAMRPLLRKLQKDLETRPDAIHKSFRALKRRRLIEIRKKDDKTMLVLSELGKKRVLHFKEEGITIDKPKRWDGSWRLVLFDIPEKYKKEREAFRAKLKGLNFYQLQKSCFVHPYECKDEIDFITELFGISPYVNFVVARSVEGEGELRNYYNL